MIRVCVDIQEGNLEICLDGGKEGFLIFTGGVVLIYLYSWFPSVVNGLLMEWVATQFCIYARL